MGSHVAAASMGTTAPSDNYTIWKEFQSNGRRKLIALTGGTNDRHRSPPSRRLTVRSHQDDAGDARRSQSTRGRDPGGAPTTGVRKRRAHERHAQTAPPHPSSDEGVRLNRLSDQDNIEAYVLTFEPMMQAYEIAPAKWSYKLAP